MAAHTLPSYKAKSTITRGYLEDFEIFSLWDGVDFPDTEFAPKGVVNGKRISHGVKYVNQVQLGFRCTDNYADIRCLEKEHSRQGFQEAGRTLEATQTIRSNSRFTIALVVICFKFALFVQILNDHRRASKAFDDPEKPGSRRPSPST